MQIKDIINSIKSLWNSITSINSNLEDTGWQTATLTEDFKVYENDNDYAPRYRKIGKLVEINGIVSPSATLKGSATVVPIFTLPAGYRPSRNYYYVCQGTTSNKWLLSISTGGTVGFSRYGVSSFVDAIDTVWLPFDFNFLID